MFASEWQGLAATPVAKRTRSKSRHPTPIAKRTRSQVDAARPKTPVVKRTRTQIRVQKYITRDKHVMFFRHHHKHTPSTATTTTGMTNVPTPTNNQECWCTTDPQPPDTPDMFFMSSILGHHSSANITPPQLQLSGTPLSPITNTQTENVYEQ